MKTEPNESSRNTDFLNRLLGTLPGDLQTLVNTLVSTLDYKTQELWGWNWWESEKHDEDTIYHPDVEGKLLKLFCIKALKILASMEDADARKIVLDVPPDWRYILRDDFGLILLLENIRVSGGKGISILNSKDISNIEILKKILKDAEIKLIREEREALRKSPVDQDEVRKFCAEAIKSFYEEALARDTLGKLSFLENRTGQPYTDGITPIGIKTVDIKEPFAKSTAGSYAAWGTAYGIEMAQLDGWLLIEAILKEFPTFSEINDSEKLFDAIRECIDALKDQLNLIIFSCNFDFLPYTVKSKYYDVFKPSFDRDLENYELRKLKAFDGVFQHTNADIPVFGFHARQLYKELLIFNKNHFGKIVQLSPLNKGDDPILLNDILKIKVRSFSEDMGLLQKYLSTPPTWLKKIRRKESRKDHLMERVLIEIYERFEFEHDTKPMGFRIKIK